MHRRSPATFWLALALILAFSLPASPARAETVLDRVRADLSAGRDVVITSYVGLWYKSNDDPASNLYWGNAYGHDTMFKKPVQIRKRLPFVQISDYTTLLTRQRKEDPLVIKVMAAPARVSAAGGRSGRIIVVYLVYRNIEQAVYQMGIQLKTGVTPAEIAGDEEVSQYLKSSYLFGYWGHNVYYGGVDIDDLESVRVSEDGGARGVFMIACMTAHWFPHKFLAGSIEPLIFTRTNMAPEAYIAVALYDALGRGLSREAIQLNVATAYKTYQNLARAPLSLFIVDRPTIDRLAAEALKSIQ